MNFHEDRRRSGEISRSRAKAGLTEEELIVYRAKKAEAKKNYRSKLSDEQQKRRRAIAAEKQRQRRAKLTPEELIILRAREIEGRRHRRAKLTPEELIIQRARQLESKRHRRAKLSAEETIFRRVQQSAMTRLRRETIKNYNTQNPQPKDRQPAENPVTVNLNDDTVGESISEVTQRTQALPLPEETPKSNYILTLTNDPVPDSQEEVQQLILEIQRLKVKVMAMKKAGLQIIKNKVESAVRSLMLTTGSCQNSGKRMNLVLPKKLIISQTEGQRKAKTPLEMTRNTRPDSPMSPELLPVSPPPSPAASPPPSPAASPPPSPFSPASLDGPDSPFSPASTDRPDSPISEPENDFVGKEERGQEEDPVAKKLKNKNDRALRAERRLKKKLELPSENDDSGSNNDYACSLCEKKFTSRARLNAHMKKHKKRTKEKIKEPKKKRKQSEQIKGPKKTPNRISTEILEDGSGSIPGKVYFCSYCPTKYSSPIGLSSHMHKHYKRDGLPDREIKEDPKKPANQKFVFETAEVGTSSENGLSSVYVCPVCQMDFDTKIGFSMHLRRQHTKAEVTEAKEKLPADASTVPSGKFTMYTCELCQEKLFNISKYREHLIQAHKENKDLIQKYCFCCPYCQDSHISKMFLTQHLRDNHGIYIQCPICDENIQTQDLFTEHVNVSHSKYSKNENFLEYSGFYVCKWCGFAKESYTIALAHYANWHSADKSYICDTCGKTFGTERAHNRHVYQSHSQKSYFCEMCAKTYNTSQTFKIHLRTHETVGFPRIPCRDPTCTKTFKTKDNARKHFLNIHQATKKFLCSVCGKYFNSRSSLMIHEVKVCEKDSAKKMPCPVCGKVLDNFLLLSYHKNNFHKYGNTEETFCHRCNKSMASAYALYAHNNQNHKNGDAEVADPNPTPKKKSSRRFKNSDLDDYVDY